MATEETFGFLYGGDLYDYLIEQSSLHTTYNTDATDLKDSGRMTIQDKENAVLDQDYSDQIVKSAALANGVELSFGGKDKANFDIEAKVTYTWEDTSGTDPVTQEVTVYLLNVEDFGDPWIVAEDGQQLPPPGTDIQMTDFEQWPDVPAFLGPEYANLICFTRGTMILTDRGDVPIEDLAADDLVVTRDRGLQPIRWIGSRSVKATGSAAPIRIRAGALGNDRDLLVSPNHRMLVEGWKAEALFGAQEVLATARQLTVRDDVHVVEGGTVEYFHILFDRHEIITANGAPSESLHPGDACKGALAAKARAEVLRLFPELESQTSIELVRPTVRDSEADLIT